MPRTDETDPPQGGAEATQEMDDALRDERISAESPGYESAPPTLEMPHPLKHVLDTDERPEPAQTAAGEDDLNEPTGAMRYEPGELLGRGGMGEVRLCRDTRLRREVALKRLRLGDAAPPETRRRFLREVRIQGRMEHPAVVPVYDLGRDEQGPYFTMRRVRGATLAQVLQKRLDGDAEVLATFTRRKLLTAMASVCLAVHYAHTRGVLHRDLKPANIMLGDFGEVYVIDWGIAKLVQSAAPLDVSATGETTGQNDLVGTTGYMAPEQLTGRSDVLDARTDVYALGSILYEVLAQRPLLEDRSVHAVLWASIEGVDARASKHVPDVAPELDAICQRAVALHPAERFQTARELALAIEHFLDGDRDLLRRRQLAAEHAAAARAASEREATDADARLTAMREVMSALALDPEEPDARRLLLELLVARGDALPAPVHERMRAAEVASRVRAARVGAWALLSWLGVVPMALVAGVRSWPVVITTFVCNVLAAGAAALFARRGRAGTLESMVLAVLTFSVVALISVWLGPFVLVPTAGSTVTLWFAMHSTGRERYAAVAIGLLAVCLPFAADMLHLGPAAYAFRDGHIELYPRALSLPPRLTLGALMYTSLGFTALPALFLGRLRDALSRAEGQLFLQSWHLEQWMAATGGHRGEREASARRSPVKA